MDDKPRNDAQRVADEDDFELELFPWIWSWIWFLWMHRKFIAVVTFSFCVAGVAWALIQPEQYTATATLLPPQVSDSRLAGILSNLGGFPGEIPGTGENMAKVYPEIARSRNVLTGLLDASYNRKTFRAILLERNEVKNHIDDILIKYLKGIIQASTAMRTNVFTLNVTYTDPDIAAALANEIMAQMETFFKYKYKSVATGQRIMIETRLKEVSDSLKIAEDRLLQFRESNRTTGVSPKLQMDEARLAREVEINNAMYIELNRQHEVSKIAEMQMRPVLNLLDRATPPIQKSKPARRKIVFVFLILGFVSAVGQLKLYPVIREQIVRAKEPHEVNR